jgi:hypothetical protein
MDDWKFFDFFLPSWMPKPEVGKELRHRVLMAAADSGDFVGGFRIGHHESYSDGWDRWTAGYLPGPPRIGRFQREMTQLRASS